MAEKKVTIMVIKVDLGCEKCKKKIKKILCSIPQIQNQIYDEKTNTVIITVVCCSPEKIKKKICCKGGCTIKGIEIKEPEKPKPPPPAEKPKEAPPKPKETEKPKEKPKETEKPKVVIVEPPKEKPKEPKPDKPKVVIIEPPKEKPKDPEPKPTQQAPPPPAPVPKAPEPVPVPVPSYPPPVRTCCTECYGGHGGGPCWEGFGRPAPCYEGYGRPAPCYEAYGRPVYDSWGSGYSYGYGPCRRGCYVGRCDCLSEENPSACSVM